MTVMSLLLAAILVMAVAVVARLIVELRRSPLERLFRETGQMGRAPTETEVMHLYAEATARGLPEDYERFGRDARRVAAQLHRETRRLADKARRSSDRRAPE